MSNVKIPGYRHHFVDEFNEENEHQNVKKTKGRLKISIEFIQDKYKRCMTFTKRRAGLMKKAYQLATLTGSQILLVVASETGHVYSYSTENFEPILNSTPGRKLIRSCLQTESLSRSKPTSEDEETFELEQCDSIRDQHRGNHRTSIESEHCQINQRQKHFDLPGTSGISTKTGNFQTSTSHPDHPNSLGFEENSDRISKLSAFDGVTEAGITDSGNKSNDENFSGIISSDESLADCQSQNSGSLSNLTERSRWRWDEFNESPCFDQQVFTSRSIQAPVQNDIRKRAYFQNDSCNLQFKHFKQ